MALRFQMPWIQRLTEGTGYSGQSYFTKYKNEVQREGVMYQLSIYSSIITDLEPEFPISQPYAFPITPQN